MRSLFLAAVVLSWQTAALAEPMCEVAQHVFTTTIVEKLPQDDLASPVSLSIGQRLFLWIDIRVNAAGVRYLKSIGHLPIYIRWGRSGWLTDPPLDIGITDRAWQEQRAAIISTLDPGGGFSWRTFAYKAPHVAGQYYATLIDANKKIVGSTDEPLRPFRPEISVQLD